MTGFVSKEREKFEQMSRKMEKDLEVKNEKLRQVKELIRNSPCPRTPFKEKNGCEGENGQHQKGSEQVQVEQQQQVADGVSLGNVCTYLYRCIGRGRRGRRGRRGVERKERGREEGEG